MQPWTTYWLVIDSLSGSISKRTRHTVDFKSEARPELHFIEDDYENCCFKIDIGYKNAQTLKVSRPKSVRYNSVWCKHFVVQTWAWLIHKIFNRETIAGLCSLLIIVKKQYNEDAEFVNMIQSKIGWWVLSIILIVITDSNNVLLWSLLQVLDVREGSTTTIIWPF